MPKRKTDEIITEIEYAVNQIIINYNGEVVPTVGLVAKMIKRRVSEIRDVIKKMKFDPIDYPMKVLTPRVILNLFKQTSTSARAVELWFKLIENWNDKININIQDYPELNFIHENKTKN